MPTHCVAALTSWSPSLVIGCATTLLAFGLLALSSFPALRALGAATAIGVLASLVLAPTLLILVGRERTDPVSAGD